MQFLAQNSDLEKFCSLAWLHCIKNQYQLSLCGAVAYAYAGGGPFCILIKRGRFAARGNYKSMPYLVNSF